MGITGEDLAKDFENAIKHLNLEDKKVFEKAKREFNDEVAVLKKDKRMIWQNNKKGVVFK